MIRADTRGRFTANDLRLVVLLLARGDACRRARWEDRLRAEGPDALLDQSELWECLLAVRSILVPSEPLFFYVAVRHTLLRIGLDDREVADYLAAVLMAFGRRDRAWRIDWNDDQRHAYIIDLLADAEQTDGERRFRVLAHLGNYALWLAGLYPDYIAARQVRRGGPAVEYYDHCGRRGFAAASDHSLASDHGLDHIFRTAAERFPSVRQALNRLSDQVLFPTVATPDRLLRELGYTN